MGQAGVEALLKTTIETAEAIAAEKKADLHRVIVDTTVSEKAIAQGWSPAQQDCRAGVQRPCLDARVFLHAVRCSGSVTDRLATQHA